MQKQKIQLSKHSNVAKPKKTKPILQKLDQKSVIKSSQLEEKKVSPPCDSAPPPESISDTDEQEKQSIIMKKVVTEITNLPEVLHAVFTKTSLTPLLIDPSKRIDTFFTYSGGELQARMLDMKPFIAQHYIQKSMSADDVKEELRKAIVDCLKYGKILCFRQGDTAFDFSKFEDGKYFPFKKILKSGGKSLFDADVYSPLLRKEDLEPYGVFVPLPDFHIIFTSSFSEDDYVEYLENTLPLDTFSVIIVK